MTAATNSAWTVIEGTATNLSERTYQELRARIVDGRLAPGTVLSERGLAEATTISRTPLRAAISRLEGEELVERLPNRGVVIRRFSTDDLLQILVVRRALEGEAAALATGQIEPATRRRLALEAESLARSEAPEFDVFWAHDDAFHAAVADASAQPLLARTITEMRGRARMCHVPRMPLSFRAQAEEHMRVLDALDGGDAARARTAMQGHLDAVRRRLVAWLSGERSP